MLARARKVTLLRKSLEAHACGASRDGRRGPPAIALRRVRVTALRPRSATAPATLVDRDGDKVFDELEPRLQGASAAEELDVIVVLDAPASLDRVRGLERSVGDFSTEPSVLDHRRLLGAHEQAADPRTRPRSGRRSRRGELQAVRALNDTAQSSFGVTKARIDAPAPRRQRGRQRRRPIRRTTSSSR